MSASTVHPTQVLLVGLVFIASFGCGGGANSSVSCDQLQPKINECPQGVKDAFAPFCPTTSDDCRQCLEGLPRGCRRSLFASPPARAWRSWGVKSVPVSTGHQDIGKELNIAARRLWVSTARSSFNMFFSCD